MKLGDFLKDAYQAPTLPVEFDVIGHDAEEYVTRARAKAAFAYVDEAHRQQANRDALAYLREQFPGGDIPREQQTAEEAFQVLRLALRDAEDPRKPLVNSTDELRRALTAPQAVRLDTAYWQWIVKEFPDTITPAEKTELEEEARKNSERAPR